ncbi:hypothetical protein SUDANB95_04297 [Actinosynnema sp. ALI-1.44]
MTGAVPRPDGEPDLPPHVANHVGDVHGPSVQAGYVAGGIHFHAPPPAAPAPRPVRDRRLARAWLAVVLLVFLVAGFGSYLLNVSVGRGSLTANLAADGVLLALAVGVLAARWRLVARDLSFAAYAGRVLARCVPRCVAMTSTPVLAIVAVVLGALLVASVFTPVTGHEYTAAQGRNGVLLFLVGLVVPVVRTLVVRARIHRRR